MSVEAAGPQMHEGIGGNPVALLVGGEHRSGGIAAEATGAPQPGANRHQFATAVRHCQRPPAPRSLAVAERCVMNRVAKVFVPEVESGVEREPERAVAIGLRAVRVFVVVAGYTPSLGGGGVVVGQLVTVGVGDPRQLAALCRPERAVTPFEAEWFVETAGEAVIVHVGRRAFTDAREKPDLPLAGRHGEATIGELRDAAHFEHQAIGGWLPAGVAGVAHGLRRHHRHEFVVRVFLLERRRRTRRHQIPEQPSVGEERCSDRPPCGPAVTHHR